jgi:cell division septal protein FtsQ
VIVDSTAARIKPGDVLPKALLAKPFELITLLKDNPTLPLKAVSEIDISDPLNIQLVTIPNAIRIKLGVSGFADKLVNLQHALPRLNKEKNNLRYIDLRYKHSVVFRRRA